MVLGPALEEGGLIADRAVPPAASTGVAGAVVAARFAVETAGVLPVTPDLHAGNHYSQASIFKGAMPLHALL